MAKVAVRHSLNLKGHNLQGDRDDLLLPQTNTRAGPGDFARASAGANRLELLPGFRFQIGFMELIAHAELTRKLRLTLQKQPLLDCILYQCRKNN